jgi:hypothetical protein
VISFAAKDRKDRKSRNFGGLSKAHPAGAVPCLSKSLSLCSLRSFAANHLLMLDQPAPGTLNDAPEQEASWTKVQP